MTWKPYRKYISIQKILSLSRELHCDLLDLLEYFLTLKMERRKKRTSFQQFKVEYEGNCINYNRDVLSWIWLMPVNVCAFFFF